MQPGENAKPSLVDQMNEDRASQVAQQQVSDQARDAQAQVEQAQQQRMPKVQGSSDVLERASAYGQHLRDEAVQGNGYNLDLIDADGKRVKGGGMRIHPPY